MYFFNVASSYEKHSQPLNTFWGAVMGVKSASRSCRKVALEMVDPSSARCHYFRPGKFDSQFIIRPGRTMFVGISKDYSQTGRADFVIHPEKDLTL